MDAIHDRGDGGADMSVEAMKQALEALEWDADYDTSVTLQKAAITALKQAIAEAEKQEPVANSLDWWALFDENQRLRAELKFNTAPPKREWVGFTAAERDEIVPMLVQSLINHDDKTMAVLLRAILIDVEERLKEKNGG